MESKRAKELAEAHWNGYVGPLVKLHSADGLMYGLDEVLELCGWHYTTALQHGHRHGVEDERNGLFRPRIGQHLPAHPYYHKDEVALPCGWSYQGSCTFTTECGKEYVYEGPMPDICPNCGRKAAIVELPTPLSPEQIQAINSSISPPSLCGTCIRQGCPVDCAEHTTECGEYLPREGDGEGVATDLCEKCGNGGKNHFKCPVPGGPGKMKLCPYFTATTVQPSPTSCRDCWSNCGVAIEEREAAECQSHTPMGEGLKLPTITVEGSVEDVRKKWREEFREWKDADDTSILKWVEAWDVIQVMQTLKERDSLLPVCSITAEMESYHKEDSERLESARRAMLLKNACRTRPDGGTGYYAPEVCERIILSGGKEW